MTQNERYTHQRWEQILESIDLEVAQMAIICQVRLFEEGVVERVLNKDSLVCSKNNPAAFEKLRALLIMHFTAHRQLSSQLGEHQAAEISQHIRQHLAPRIGDQLGGPLPVS